MKETTQSKRSSANADGRATLSAPSATVPNSVLTSGNGPPSSPRSWQNSPGLLSLLILGSAVMAKFTTSVFATVPGILNYQGRVTVSNVSHDDPGFFKFALVNSAGTETYWSHDDTSENGSEPASSVELTVTKGLFAVNLGDTTIPNMMEPVPAGVFENEEVYLNVWFSTDDSVFNELTPRLRISAVGYALNAALAEAVKDGAVTATGLAAGAADDADADPTNELISSLTLNGNSLEINESGNMESIDLSSLMPSSLASPDGQLSNAVVVEADGGVGIGTESVGFGVISHDTNGDGLSNPFGLAVSGNYAYVGDLVNDVLAIFDVSDPDNIVAKDTDGTVGTSKISSSIGRLRLCRG